MVLIPHSWYLTDPTNSLLGIHTSEYKGSYFRVEFPCIGICCKRPKTNMKGKRPSYISFLAMHHNAIIFANCPLHFLVPLTVVSLCYCLFWNSAFDKFFPIVMIEEWMRRLFSEKCALESEWAQFVLSGNGHELLKGNFKWYRQLSDHKNARVNRQVCDVPIF